MSGIGKDGAMNTPGTTVTLRGGDVLPLDVAQKMFRTIVRFWRDPNAPNHVLLERTIDFLQDLPPNLTHQDWYSHDFKSRYIDVDRVTKRDTETFIRESGLDILDHRMYGHMISILRNSFTMEEFLSIVLRDPLTGSSEYEESELLQDPAMRGEKGGIDLNSAHLNLVIKRDGNGVPLPLAQQDLAQLSNIQGLDPVILSIKPASQTPLFAELVAQP